MEEKEKRSTGGNSEKGKGKKVKAGQPKKAAVNEDKIDLFLEMIKGADVTSDENFAENTTLLELEGTYSFAIRRVCRMCHSHHNCEHQRMS